MTNELKNVVDPTKLKMSPFLKEEYVEHFKEVSLDVAQQFIDRFGHVEKYKNTAINEKDFVFEKKIINWACIWNKVNNINKEFTPIAQYGHLIIGYIGEDISVYRQEDLDPKQA